MTKKATPAPVKGKPAKAPVKQLPEKTASGATAVEKHNANTAMVLASAAPDIATMLTEDAGSGMETMRADSFAIPRLALLQKMSPQLEKTKPEFIEGAEVGMILDSVSGQLYDGQDGILVVLVSYLHSYINWWPRNSQKGKGFIQNLGNDPKCLINTKPADKVLFGLPNGSEIVPTHEYFALIIDEDDLSITRALIPLTKTQYKKGKQLNTATQLLINVGGVKRLAPLFYRTYRFSAIPESNNDGNWFGWKIEPGPALLANDLQLPVLEGGEKIYLEARAFKTAVNKDEVKVQDRNADQQHSGGDSGGRTSDDAPM